MPPDARDWWTGKRLRVVVAFAAALAAWASAPSALGDGDPASDVLIGQSVFYPYSSTVSGSLQRTLNGEVAAAGRAHFPIKVALIASPADLGSATPLFGKPEQYATFLGAEITFVNVEPHLLVVMPNGYGVRNLGPAATRASATLEKPGGALGDDLALAAIAALPKLAAAAGQPIGPVSGAPSGGGGSTALKVAGLAIAAVVIAGAFLALRRRGQRGAGDPRRAAVRVRRDASRGTEERRRHG